MTEDYKAKVDRHERILIGNPENMAKEPGLVVSHNQTVEILADIKKSVNRIVWLIIIAVLGALLNGVLKVGH